jgi:hypothetical protein
VVGWRRLQNRILPGVLTLFFPGNSTLALGGRVMLSMSACPPSLPPLSALAVIIGMNRVVAYLEPFNAAGDDTRS